MRLFSSNIPAEILRARWAWLLLLIAIFGGALGYILIEGFSVIDALYMAVISLSTVGFGEVEPLSPAGRAFTSFHILFNTMVLAYVLAVFSYYIIEGKIFQSMQAISMRSRIDKLKDHVIICGFGRYGQEVASHLKKSGTPYVAIDLSEERMLQLAQSDPDMLFIAGDATQDEVLHEAGIDKAKGLISALLDDGDNMFIVLSARQLRPQLHIVSRAQQVRSEGKLKKAGADHVIMPERMGGFYMATLMSKPQAVEFFSFLSTEINADVGFEVINYSDLPADCRNQSLGELHLRRQFGINVIGHQRIDGVYEVNPAPGIRLKPGESFIALGSSPQLQKLKDFIS